MIKILHTADVQLGAQFKTLGNHAELQRAQLKKTFHRALETAVREKAGLVLIAGDLFDSNHPSYELVEFVRSEMKYLKENNIVLAIVPGHHDCLQADGIYNRVRFDADFPNVFIFRNPDGEVKEYPDLNLAIFAKPNIANTSTKSPLPDVGRPTSHMKYKILAAHGDLQIPGKSAENYHPISIPELETLTDINYIALGHWHSMKDCSSYGNFKMPVWYSGSPELVAFDQEGAGNILLVDFTEVGTRVEPLKVGQHAGRKLALDVSQFGDIAEIKKKIFELKDPNFILEVELTGLNTNNIPILAETLEEEVSESFFHIRVSDKSHLVLQEIPEYSDALLQGQFVKIMQKKIGEVPDVEKKIYEDALQMGLLELSGKEIL